MNTTFLDHTPACLTGAGTAAAAGYPDYGLLTMSEMADNAARIADSVDVPVIADADTGFGNELNVVRTVRAYGRAGVAALHIENQEFPKRCGHAAGKQIVDRDPWLRKIRAAVECRLDPDMVIIARSDAQSVSGLDEAVDRANAALAVGADLAFVEAPQSTAELREVPRRVQGACVVNVVPGGRSPDATFAELEQWGYRLAICPGAVLWPVVVAAEKALGELAEVCGVAGTVGVGGGPKAQEGMARRWRKVAAVRSSCSSGSGLLAGRRCGVASGLMTFEHRDTCPAHVGRPSARAAA